MAATQYYIAVDLGAESGRVMRGSVDEQRLALEEIHRFGNGPIEIDGALHWDFEQLMTEIKAGIAQAVRSTPGGRVSGISVDSWGVDFGLLDGQGKLLEPPYHYRDARTEGAMEQAFDLVGRRRLYDLTGTQFMRFNSVFQLLAQKRQAGDLLARAHKLVFMADLVAYHLCGRAFGEYTLASTSQLMDMRTGQWCDELFGQLGLPRQIMPEVVAPGTVVGRLTDAVCAELGCAALPVIASGSHDTASAVAAVPAEPGRWLYLSSGTWSLMGAETDAAFINDTTYDCQFTNEGGVCGTIRLLKNIMGLWLVQECRRQWQQEGADYSYADLARMAAAAEPFVAHLSPADEAFMLPGEMPSRINAWLQAHGQAPVTDKGQMIRVILESLALEYRRVLDMLRQATGADFDVLHIVGGGIQNELLCQFAADALGMRVVAGPVEATASGNILMQALATGQIGSLAEARALVRRSTEPKTYQPHDTAAWTKQYQAYQA